MNEEQKKYEVDGIVFYRDDGKLIMEFRIDTVIHTFLVKDENARKMAEVMGEMYFSAN